MSDNIPAQRVYPVLRCPSTCDPHSCSVKHDAVLVELLNVDADISESAYDKHLRLLRLMKKFEQMNDWSLTTPLSDPVEEYRMPLLHWAFKLGSVNVIRYILEEATIHPNSHLFRITNGKRSSLSVLYDALIMRETFGSNTPLHLCSEMLANSSHVQPNNRHLCCIISLLDFVEDRQQRVEQSAGLQWQEIFNVRNRSGETPLHHICRNMALVSLVERFVVAGADVSLVGSSLSDVLSHSNTNQSSRSGDEYQEACSSFDADEVDQVTASDQPFVQEILSQFGIECTNGDTSDLWERLSHCNTSTLRSIRAAVVDGLARLQEKSDVVEKALSAMEEAQRRVYADRQKAIDRLSASKREKKLLHEKLRKLERQAKASEDRMTMLQLQKEEYLKCLARFDASGNS